MTKYMVIGILDYVNVALQINTASEMPLKHSIDLVLDCYLPLCDDNDTGKGKYARGT
jgi:hypothetical protein